MVKEVAPHEYRQDLQGGIPESDSFSGAHHDGTNNYLYRELRDLSDKQMENFLYKLHTGRLTRRDIRRYTTSVGIHINKVYGW